MSKQKIILCDIDGCLIYTAWVWKVITLLGIKDDATKWDFFGRNANALYNKIDKNLVKFLQYEMRIRDAKIMFFTARDINIEPSTIDFIEKATGFVYETDFYISSRPYWDKTTTPESKRARLELIKKFFEPVFAIDDELVNCELLNRYNIPTLLWTIGFEPKLVEYRMPQLITEYREAIKPAEQEPNNKLKAYSMGELSVLFEDLIQEMNDRKANNEHGDGFAFSLGYKDSNGETIFTGDILKTPDGSYGTAVWDDRRPAILSPGSNAIDYDNEAFFNSCCVVTNIRKSPDFYETLVPEVV